MALVLLALLMQHPPATPQKEDHLKAALDAARVREDRLTTFVISWKTTTHVPKGGRMDADPVGLPLPRADQKWETTYSLIMDGDRFRLNEDSPNGPGVTDGQFVFDGVQLMNRISFSGRKHATVVYERPRRPVEFAPVHLTPVALWCRGYHRWTEETQRQTVEAIEGDVLIDGSRCREFRMHRASGAIDFYWLDVNQGHRVRRIERRSDARTEVVDVVYREHGMMTWVPHTWSEIRTRKDGKIAQTIQAEVTDVRIGEPVPPETFRLLPSPGDYVSNHESNTTFRVRADGSLEEIGLTTGTVPPKNETPKPPPAWPARNTIRVLVIMGLAGVVLVALILRHRGRASHTPTP